VAATFLAATAVPAHVVAWPVVVAVAAGAADYAQPARFVPVPAPQLDSKYESLQMKVPLQTQQPLKRMM
jgi:hypothetical protein